MDYWEIWIVAEGGTIGAVVAANDFCVETVTVTMTANMRRMSTKRSFGPASVVLDSLASLGLHFDSCCD